jgi:MFS family permease
MFLVLLITIIELVLVKFLNKKTSSILYKLSFLLIFFSILLAFFVTEKNLWVVWIIEFIYSISLIFYYIPHEIAIMGKTKNYSVKKFFGVSSIVASISAILSPFISGFILGTWSYSVIFIIIAVFAIISFILSFFIKDFYTDKSNFKIKRCIYIKS